MKIELKHIKIRDIYNGFINNEEEGVVGYGGNLNIRPKYQREFVYKEKQRDAVIETINKTFPLNVMYWVKIGEDHFEVLDGQQRTISFCEYIDGSFSINYRYFHNLTTEEQNKILDYEIMVYICEGTTEEQLEWFKTINIAGEKLYDQELRNALYTGEWLTDAKKKFSKTGCAAYEIANKYMGGSPIRQDYLETALRWKIDDEDLEAIELYMAHKQADHNANELWLFFSGVIEWVKTIFTNYRKEMKGIEWGKIYNKYHKNDYDSNKIESEIAELMSDDDVTNQKGIYEFIFSRDEKHLNIRAFTDSIKRVSYEKQDGKCNSCKKPFDIKEMEADHIDPWSKGGKTSKDNCQMLCRPCNRRKSDK